MTMIDLEIIFVILILLLVSLDIFLVTDCFFSATASFLDRGIKLLQNICHLIFISQFSIFNQFSLSQFSNIGNC